MLSVAPLVGYNIHRRRQTTHLDIQHLLHQYGYAVVFLSFSLKCRCTVAETTLTISGVEWSLGAFYFVPFCYPPQLGT